ncbi:HlyD family secretion protein [Treponema denticola]|uniref:HlyD family secretion protein n=1 Tax=Treponema denticola TaxID=158 RepID=UPI0020A6061C|nr:HlyD family secretion protein [Treponema denticola]
MEEVVYAKGQVRPVQNISLVKNIIAGEIVQINYLPGQKIEKGVELVKIDDSIYSARKEALQAYYMVKKLFFMFMCCILSSLYAIEYEEFIAGVLTNSNEYQKALSKYNIKKTAAQKIQYRWIPKLSLKLNYISNVEIKTHDQIHAFTTGLNLKQTLPMGMGLTFNIDNTFALSKIKGAKNEYSSSSKTQFSMPLYFFAPAILKPYAEHEFYLGEDSISFVDLELQRIREKIIAEAIYVAVSYWLQKKTIAIEEEKSQIDLQLGLNDEALWKQGKLSTLELSERNTKRYNNQLNLLNSKKRYLQMLHTLNLTGMGADAMPSNIESWIKKLESYISHEYINTDTEFLLKQKQLKVNQYYTLKEQLNRLPSFIFSFTLDPASKSKGGVKFKDTIQNYWKAEKSWLFNFAVGINIPLSPLDEVYDIDKTTKELLNLNKLEIEALSMNYQNKKEVHEINLNILNEVCILAEKNKENIQNRLASSEVLLKQGYITEIDFKIQNLDYQLSQLNSLKARLDYIIEVLNY